MAVTPSTLKALLSADGWQRMSRALSLEGAAPTPAVVELDAIQAAVATFEAGSSDRARLEKLLAQAGARTALPATPPAPAIALGAREEVLLGRGQRATRDAGVRLDATVSGLTDGGQRVVRGAIGDDGWFVVRCDLGPGDRIRARSDVQGREGDVGRLLAGFTPRPVGDDVLDQILLGGGTDPGAVELFGAPGRASPVFLSLQGRPGADVAMTIDHLETTVAYEPLSPRLPVRIPCVAGAQYVVDLSDSEGGARVEVSFVDAYGTQSVLKLVEHEERVRAPGNGALLLQPKTDAQGALHVVRAFGDGT